ncbi:MAG: ferrochelatase [Candidatus Neomarinimicrobiota bacterium]
MTRTAVVLMNLGGPASLAEVEPFLVNLFRDVVRFPWGAAGSGILGRFIARRRRSHAQGLYRQIGGGSPILQETQAQAAALQSALDGGSSVSSAMRYSPPFISDSRAPLQADGHGWDRIVALPLFPQYSFATTRTCQRAWESARNQGRTPTTLVGAFHRQPDFVAAQQELLQQTLTTSGRPDAVHVVFSAHSVPLSYIRRGDPYRDQVEETVRLVMTGLPNPYTIAYQSRVGPVKWLEPATLAHVQELGKRGVTSLAVVPIAFVCEHLETLYELDILVRAAAEQAGVDEYLRVPAPGVHPKFIAALAHVVQHPENYPLP